MIVVKFRSVEDHEDVMHKLKKMKKFTEELEEMLNECYEEEEPEYRGGSYRKSDPDEYETRGRYGYRMGGSRR